MDLKLVRIREFGVLQTAKVLSILYFILAAIFCLPIGAILLLIPKGAESKGPSGAIFLVLPFFYGIATFVFVALGCLLYNFIGEHFGGIELHIADAPIEAENEQAVPPARS